MKNVCKLSHAKREIVMDRTFAKLAENTMSAEYAHLQQVRKDYPTYTVIKRQIKRNGNKESYIHLPFGAFHILFNQLRKHLNNFRFGTLCHKVGIRTELVYVPLMIRVVAVVFHPHNVLLAQRHIFIVLT